jgi:hypothetical protein
VSFLERAKVVAGQAAGAAAKVSVDVGGKAAKVGVEVGTKAATTIRDPATKARAHSALKKAKVGFTTALERIDPKILADVVIKATSLQEKANASLRDRGSVYRISEIAIGAAIPPSITFSIGRIDESEELGLSDSRTLLANASVVALEPALAPDTIVTLDGTAIDGEILDEVEEDLADGA